MDMNKFSNKTLEYIEKAQNMAIKNSNPELNEKHLALAMFLDSDGLIYRLVNLMGENSKLISQELKNMVEQLPIQSGGGLTASTVYQRILLKAEDESKKLNDSYIGIEHIFLA